MTAIAHPTAHVREAGHGAALVCIHASASSGAQWRPLMERLAERFRIMAVDLYGSGHSPEWPGERPLSLADEVALLEPVFAAAGPRFHLVGHSYGGAVALKAALTDPGRLASLVLYEPVLFSLLTAEDPDQPAAQEIIAVRDDTSAAIDRGDLAGAAARFIDYWMGAGTWAGMPEARRASIAPAMRSVNGHWRAAFGEPAPLHAFAEVDTPTACLVGRESPAASRRVTALLAKTLPRVTVAEIEGVGHMGPVTHPHRINVLIEEHIDQHH